jgi:ubiquinone/menaquinone biosynthesis C-methylase UbiE
MNFVTAMLYNAFLAPAERLCLHEIRAKLLSPLSGKILELGAGTGRNINYYPASVESLVLAEPDANMRGHLTSAVRRSSHQNHVEISAANAEQLPFENGRFDFVVATLVYCSVSDLRQSLSETSRVLAPHGKLCLIEHVASPRGSKLRKQQAWMAPLWRHLAAGCELERDPRPILSELGFNVATTTLDVFRGAPRFLRPLLHGTVTRA